MSQLFSLSAEQPERIKPFFPRSHGIPRVDDRKVISGIIYVIKHGLVNSNCKCTGEGLVKKLSGSLVV